MASMPVHEPTIYDLVFPCVHPMYRHAQLHAPIHLRHGGPSNTLRPNGECNFPTLGSAILSNSPSSAM
eukprot:scaffold217416_cov40-Tisochrysis_lutea.AAC.3